ncbi:MAG: hypothetical protein R3B97_11225 [Dehalococcoidia bacterium]|nr:hypothetical protein [Dehalococcoidia bacterium]
MIRDSLLPVLPRLEYVALARCGHYPWLERYGRAPGFKTLREWLRAHPTVRDWRFGHDSPNGRPDTLRWFLQ